MKYFLSDPHFYDEGLMKYCGRPFSSVEEMHRAIIDNFKNKVAGAGEIYILGDITGKNGKSLTREDYARVLGEMGINDPNTPFHLILGNHDTLPAEDYMDMGFVSVRAIGDVQIGKFKAMLTHDPCMVQQENTLALCGHVHTLFDHVCNIRRNTLAINMSVEVRDYSPVSEDEVIAMIKNTAWKYGEE
ncbi:MAG: metallophosphoesterase [Synergistaceae bacterium]|nr:metallophosphoesterase [Synergistaceae bacterium]